MGDDTLRKFQEEFDKQMPPIIKCPECAGEAKRTIIGRFARGLLNCLVDKSGSAGIEMTYRCSACGFAGLPDKPTTIIIGGKDLEDCEDGRTSEED